MLLYVCTQVDHQGILRSCPGGFARDPSYAMRPPLKRRASTAIARPVSESGPFPAPNRAGRMALFRGRHDPFHTLHICHSPYVTLPLIVSIVAPSIRLSYNIKFATSIALD
ncbi:uncharacterized protein K489DRAFT_184031 [Dissoconium aciculare CBS 342.82]|jgi:hypothetical protein|uniref:Uncharacterized protein n=1 Tax=Dissoconium aciculare CBS 342.82 TaxID=1314786 RepID=A0A6J3MCF7_9PEZI|nr:uncharacterized protein K489DRAFT_184031 [Dissoconium aciculare CBS 342.82]KAF1824517.1 hypothetical protein K489DRAFT_184031 [Dissoconium aciculare CBS 342.82]